MADTPSLGRASSLLAAGTLVSRVLGFMSALVLAQTIGTRFISAEAFTLANQLPNNIYAIVAGGVLGAVLVPQIVRAGLHDDGGRAFVNRLVTLGLVVFMAAAVLATLAAPALVALYAQQAGGFTGPGIALATAFAYWCLPQVLFYALYSLLGEVLNARHVFGPFTWAPVLNNVVAIAGMLAFIALFGSGERLAAEQWSTGMIALLAGSATLGVAAQALVLWLFWRRAGLSYRPDFRWRGVGLGRAGKAAAWTFGMILVTQLAGIVQTNVAARAVAEGEAALAILRYSWLVFMLPHSIVTVSVATAYFTRMSGHARDGRLGSVATDVTASMRAIGLLITFASVGLIVIALPFSALFAAGDPGAVRSMAGVLAAFLPGLVPFSMLFVLQRTFYALEDTRTPFLATVFQASLFVIGATIVATLPAQGIAVGIAVVTTLAGAAQTLLVAILLRRRLGSIGGWLVLRRHLLFLLATAPAAAAGFGVLTLLGQFDDEGFAVATELGAAASMLLAGSLMAVLYLGTLLLMRNEELGLVIRPLLSRLRRR